ncbi:SusC/RagA family TonB-linked outer membrane protein [Pedobacter metabolipauper]|uniref:TonB-linked SusC/RagA family outer membrane protein n=1 Tax=Pedobacter metabolipauper TaxID=425513 RepID=A0A4V3D1K8_9SPHI|nr:TonB-dependent receptor [Pedobacter metabolipauper]TDQ11543.1 TonB-linked SusC/RagA family outer membrane protein [Pedobacter metabolipauper]
MKKSCTLKPRKMQVCIFLLSLFLIAAQTTGFAQTPGSITVKGVVYDAANRLITLPGVGVLLKGGDKSTVTDANGKFQIQVPSAQSVLVFSYVGMQPKEVTVGTQLDLSVYLEADSKALDEVLVTGYGTQKKSDVTGSVGVVTAKELLNAPVTNALQGLKGKVAGVNIFLNSGSPTGSPRVLIRGLGTINSSSDALYVVDGVVMENIQVLNPNDIERIEVLKDASSTAIYGARGANGVILITTKRGSATEGVLVGFDTYVSAGVLPKKLQMLNSKEYLEVIRRGFENDAKYRPTAVHPVFSTSDPRLFDASGNPLYDTDWQDEATRTAVSYNHQLSVLGKSEKSSFGAFLNYANTEGIMLNSWLNRINGKIAYDANPKKWLSLGLNVLVNNTKANETQEDGGGQAPRRSMLEMPPIFPVKFPDGSWANSSQITDPFALEAIANPVHVLTTQDRLRKLNQIFGNTYVTFHILPGLDLRTQFGFDKRDNLLQNYNPNDLVNISSPLGSASIENQHSFYWQEETYLNFNKEFGDHRINSVLGLSWQERTYEGGSISAQGFSDNFFKFNSIQSASLPGAPTSSFDEWSMNSYFIRGSYSYKNRYLATFTGRIDGSSRFGENSKYGVFPSVGLGWVVSEEPFLKDIESINEFKIRSSYGITGNTEIPTYQSLGTISSSTTLINGTRVSTSFVNRLANPDLEWEKSKQFDIGFDLALFNRRITLGFDYYHKLTTDLLLDKPLPTSSGFGSVRDNIGSVSNKGVEVLLSGSPVRNIDFTWQSTLNFSYNKNKIEALGANGEDIFPGPSFVSGSQTILRVGESLSSFWGYRRLGTWGTNEAAEAALVGAIPGVAKRSTERTVIGKGIPDWNGSFINNFRYKNIDLSVDLQFVYGVEILQQFLHSTEDRTGYANGFKSTLYDSWTEQNQNTMIQQIRNGPYSGQNSEVDDHWAANGSYLRGSAITLGYNLGQQQLTKWNIKNLRIYASVQNAFLIKSDEFKGYDPEATSYGDNQWGQNIYFHQYPKPRTFTLGASFQF